MPLKGRAGLGLLLSILAAILVAVVLAGPSLTVALAGDSPPPTGAQVLVKPDAQGTPGVGATPTRTPSSSPPNTTNPVSGPSPDVILYVVMAFALGMALGYWLGRRSRRIEPPTGPGRPGQTPTPGRGGPGGTPPTGPSRPGGTPGPR